MIDDKISVDSHHYLVGKLKYEMNLVLFCVVNHLMMFQAPKPANDSNAWMTRSLKQLLDMGFKVRKGVVFTIFIIVCLACRLFCENSHNKHSYPILIRCFGPKATKCIGHGHIHIKEAMS